MREREYIKKWKKNKNKSDLNNKRITKNREIINK